MIIFQSDQNIIDLGMASFDLASEPSVGPQNLHKFRFSLEQVKI